MKHEKKIELSCNLSFYNIFIKFPILSLVLVHWGLILLAGKGYSL